MREHGEPPAVVLAFEPRVNGVGAQRFRVPDVTVDGFRRKQLQISPREPVQKIFDVASLEFSRPVPHELDGQRRSPVDDFVAVRQREVVVSVDVEAPGSSFSTASRSLRWRFDVASVSRHSIFSRSSTPTSAAN